MKAKDAFQITAIGVHKIAEAERRAFRLKAEQSEQEAELLRKDGNLDRAKKFLEQETKWRTKMAQSDEAIYKDYKAQGRDSRSGIGANTLRMAAQAMKKALADGKTLAEATKVYQDTLAALLSKAHDVALIPEADGAEFIKPTDGAREAFKGWAAGKQHVGDANITNTKYYESKAATDPEYQRLLERRNTVMRKLKTASGSEEDALFDERARLTTAIKAIEAKYAAKAKDGILSSPFMALAALLAILSHFNKETVGPQDYDLTTYKPKRKIF